MHFDDPAAAANDPNDTRPWYHLLNRYHWFVLVVSALGWLFDCLDQQLFNLARGPAISELMGPQHVQFYGGLATTIFMLGWATGGIIFGIMGDRYGRAKTMVITILLYSLFTGLSALSTGFWDFAFYRFLTGLGVGGEFAVGVALVAEVMPERARPHALGWLQALSAVGNIMAAFVSMGLAPLEAAGALGEWKPWRYMFIIGALPALLALIIRRKLKEPERWQAMKSAGQKLGSFSELLGDPRWRRNAIVGLVLATSGVVGLWGIGFFSFDLVRSVFRSTFETELRTADAMTQERQFLQALIAEPGAKDQLTDSKGKAIEGKRQDLVLANPARFDLLDAQHRAIFKAVGELDKAGTPITPDAVLAAAKGIDAADARKAIFDNPPASGSFTASADGVMDRTKELAGKLTLWAGINGLLFNIGAFFGIYSFSKITSYIGRKPTFAVTFILALASTAFTFWNLKVLSEVFWMVPIMGFCQIALFGGYAIYFPELFPTRLRSTGTSFCYNVGRYIAAAGPLLMGTLAQMVFGHLDQVTSWRYAGVTMCSFFLIGLLALPFAPETKGKPLPE